MKLALKDAYATAYAAYQDLLSRLDEIGEVARNEEDLEELADTAYMLREMATMLKRLRVKADKLGETAQARACAMGVQSDTEIIRTPHCTATLDMKMNPKLPTRSRDPEGYAAMMDFLQVPRGLWDVPEDQHSAVDLKWPGMVDLVSNLVAEGKPLPPGVKPDSTKPLFRLLMRKRKGVLED